MLEQKPTVVCLCGSTRFRDAFTEANRKETLDGKIVLAPGLFGRSGDLEPSQYADGTPLKIRLDELHKRKIDLSDEILVINVDGYIGQSTTEEIEYALRKRKRVRWFDPFRIPSQYATEFPTAK